LLKEAQISLIFVTSSCLNSILILDIALIFILICRYIIV